jgi:hypothetical protein
MTPSRVLLMIASSADSIIEDSQKLANPGLRKLVGGSSAMLLSTESVGSSRAIGMLVRD